MKIAILVFPGTNCELDCQDVLSRLYGQDVSLVWHREESLGTADVVVVPGGFAYGDYLRPGAIARFSPVMRAVERFAAAGGPVLGICNGFQVLAEAGLLPGALLRNESLLFRCQWVHLRVENNASLFTSAGRVGQVLEVPINHNDGRYFVGREELARMEANGQIAFRYCDAQGRVTAEANPNGSIANIAGITNEAGNVLGLMPHPERCADAALGHTDGRLVFDSLLRSLSSPVKRAAVMAVTPAAGTV
ncbi:MAG: phosphoribosylformylglycinamidine synthase subunit PurQ [Chloroflexi bacterium]|nr:phosphoribosylformylglycinamidine synthase subunit PurQ [Chloroflexota bacterium]